MWVHLAHYHNKKKLHRYIKTRKMSQHKMCERSCVMFGGCKVSLREGLKNLTQVRSENDILQSLSNRWYYLWLTH